jgi:hypothetical protein
MPKPIRIFCPWLTPKIFPRFDDPRPRVREFFDHYREWIDLAELTTIAFCAGNGDHILNYRGKAGWNDAFDWARFTAYNGGAQSAFTHNRDWLNRVREGGERSYNPYMAGPSVIISEEILNYRILNTFYDAFRDEAKRRGINFKLLEYLEPGPEFCKCEWKTVRHPEGASGSADCGGTINQGVIDVCSTLKPDTHPYASFPTGIPAGINTGDFCIAQTDAFTRDFGLDGVLLGNQFGLAGFWHPDNAPSATVERRNGIKRFFHNFRRVMGSKLIYWMDTYWPADVEIEKWTMSEENYAQVDAVIVSNFAVIVERTQIAPNVESRVRIAKKFGGKPATLFSVDFVDPWYWYRVYLDDRKNFLFQHEMYKKLGGQCDGVTFFANDTFGHYVMPQPLGETLAAVRAAHG